MQTLRGMFSFAGCIIIRVVLGLIGNVIDLIENGMWRAGIAVSVSGARVPVDRPYLTVCPASAPVAAAIAKASPHLPEPLVWALTVTCGDVVVPLNLPLGMVRDALGASALGLLQFALVPIPTAYPVRLDELPRYVLQSGFRASFSMRFPAASLIDRPREAEEAAVAAALQLSTASDSANLKPIANVVGAHTALSAIPMRVVAVRSTPPSALVAADPRLPPNKLYAWQCAVPLTRSSTPAAVASESATAGEGDAAAAAAATTTTSVSQPMTLADAIAEVCGFPVVGDEGSSSSGWSVYLFGVCVNESTVAPTAAAATAEEDLSSVLWAPLAETAPSLTYPDGFVYVALRERRRGSSGAGRGAGGAASASSM